MKKFYLKPLASVIKIAAKDVITLSPIDHGAAPEYSFSDLDWE